MAQCPKKLLSVGVDDWMAALERTARREMKRDKLTKLIKQVKHSIALRKQEIKKLNELRVMLCHRRDSLL